MFFVYLSLHIPATINKTSNLNFDYAVSFDQWKKSYRNANFQKKGYHLYLSPFNGFMLLAFFRAKI